MTPCQPLAYVLTNTINKNYSYVTLTGQVCNSNPRKRHTSALFSPGCLWLTTPSRALLPPPSPPLFSKLSVKSYSAIDSVIYSHFTMTFLCKVDPKLKLRGESNTNTRVAFLKDWKAGSVSLCGLQGIPLATRHLRLHLKYQERRHLAALLADIFQNPELTACFDVLQEHQFPFALEKWEF